MTSRSALLIDFGSTYTKLRAVDLDSGGIMGSGQSPSTADTDITIGMRAALADLERRMGSLPRFEHRLASSSAAGGLRMVTIGLVPDLTAEAARRAALGAGARLIGTFAYRLGRADVDRVRALSPDIILLAGGTDGGNTEVALHNARAIARSGLTCPVIFAGNRDIGDDVRDVLGERLAELAGNVMPEFNVLEIDSARAAIRRIFLRHIVHAKGVDRANRWFDAVLMPTPAAVLEGAQLLADGPEGKGGFGSLLVVDPGGATTDVHSICDGAPSREGVVVRGLPEPRAKRTVEGDLGMRHNIHAIVEAAGIEAIAQEADLPAADASTLVEHLASNVGHLPAREPEQRLDRALGRVAVALAVRRHAGRLETVYTVHGPTAVQYGKDLGPVPAIIGTGGVIVHGADARGILQGALASAEAPESLLPVSPDLYLDRDYVLFACGLLAAVDAHAAWRLGMQSMVRLSNGGAQ